MLLLVLRYNEIICIMQVTAYMFMKEILFFTASNERRQMKEHTWKKCITNNFPRKK